MSPHPAYNRDGCLSCKLFGILTNRKASTATPTSWQSIATLYSTLLGMQRWAGSPQKYQQQAFRQLLPRRLAVSSPQQLRIDRARFGMYLMNCHDLSELPVLPSRKQDPAQYTLNFR